jgi:thioredoxin-related protein
LSHECYYCEQLFETKEKLYDHLDVHTKISEKQTRKKKTAKKESEDIVKGESTLSEDELLEQFNSSKSGEPSRMSSKS